MWWYYNDVIFPQIPTTNTPQLARDTGSLVSSKTDLCSAAVIAVLYVITWYIGPHYNDTDYLGVFCYKGLRDLILLSQRHICGK